MKPLRISLILATTLCIAWLFTSQIISLNKVRAEGRTIYLDLQPVDPRALMLGDYMQLRYTEERVPEGMEIDDLPPKGNFIMSVDENQLARFSHLASQKSPGPNEVKFNYTRTDSRLSFGAPRYYFESGTAETYESARYGVFKVSLTGKAILVGLADEDFDLIEPKSVP